MSKELTFKHVFIVADAIQRDIEAMKAGMDEFRTSFADSVRAAQDRDIQELLVGYDAGPYPVPGDVLDLDPDQWHYTGVKELPKGGGDNENAS